MNKGAQLIATSAVRDTRWRSYVAVGFPFWMKDLFESEMGTSGLDVMAVS